MEGCNKELNMKGEKGYDKKNERHDGRGKTESICRS